MELLDWIEKRKIQMHTTNVACDKLKKLDYIHDNTQKMVKQVV